MPDYYYYPSAEQGEVRQRIGVNENKGPYDTILFHANYGVKIRVAMGPGAARWVDIFMYIPRGVQVKFRDNLFTAKDLLSGKMIDKKADTLYYYEGTQKIEKDFFSILEGGNTFYHGYNQPMRRYYIDFEWNELNFESFKLRCPGLEINGKQYNIPEVTFTKKSGFFAYPIAG
jgi:hypothetical protein